MLHDEVLMGLEHPDQPLLLCLVSYPHYLHVPEFPLQLVGCLLPFSDHHLFEFYLVPILFLKFGLPLIPDKVGFFVVVAFGIR